MAKRAVAKKKPAYKPWKQASATGKLLVKLVDDGTIDLHDTPKAIWLSHRAFQEHNLVAFRAAINRLRAKNGLEVEAEDGRLLLVAIMLCIDWLPCL
jgi:hypothetical protein